MIEIKAALKQAMMRLNESSTTPRIDAEVLLAHTLKTSRTFLFTHPEQFISNTEWRLFDSLVTKRCAGHPIAYLTGIREFWSIPLHVNADTLIPRPETELLVEIVLKLLAPKTQAAILDLGTGSGAIAIAIASEKKNWQVHAADISVNALQVAQKNIQEQGLINVTLYQSNWLTDVPPHLYDAIVANPPYIAEQDPHLQHGDLRFEPPNALISGADGLDAIRHLIRSSPSYLTAGGLLLLEHGYQQKEAVLALLTAAGFESCQSWQDWQGNDRISGGWLPNF